MALGRADTGAVPDHGSGTVRQRRRPLARLGRAAVVIGRLALLTTAVILLQRLQKEGAWEAKVFLPLIFLVLLATFAKRRSEIKVWALYVAGFMAFVQLRTYADETGIPHFVSYPITMDQIMFLGEVPTAWLQKHLHQPGSARIYEIVFALTYFTYFFAPHITAITTWRLKPELFPRVPLAILVTFHIGLIGYFLVPTVPPWLADNLGRGPETARVLVSLTAEANTASFENASRNVGANDVGAMPSLHMALTVIVALTLAECGRGWKYAGRVYAGMMALSLVYLGEHYVTDILAGCVLGLGVWKLSAQGFRVPAFVWNRSRQEKTPRLEPALVAETEAPERVA